MTHTPETASSGVWVSVVEAGRILRLSERSVRRGISSGRLVSVIQDGKRVVRIEGDPVTTSGGGEHRHATGGQIVEMKPDTTGGGVIERHLVEAINTIAEEQRRTVMQARRASRMGWSLAAFAFVLAASLAVWAVQAVEREKGRTAAAMAAAGVWQRQAETERQRQADRVVIVEADRQGGGSWPGFPFPSP
jgi:hypothetical protein